MSICAVCGQTSDAGASRTLRTARQLGPGQGGMLTYGDFQDHTFFVCAACTQRDRVLRPASYLAIGAVALVVVIALIARTASVFAILAVFVAAAGLVGLVMQTSLRSKLERLAFRERGGSALNGYIIVDPRMRPR